MTVGTDRADGVLVIGYGNALRSDDGLGWHVAERLADDPRLSGATILRRQQLTPELALEVSRAAFVVFVDAGSGPPGVVTIEPVDAAPSATVTWSHHVEPAVLLALAGELFGSSARGAAVSVGVESTAAGEVLTPRLAALLPEVIEAVVRLATDRAPAAETVRA